MKMLNTSASNQRAVVVRYLRKHGHIDSIYAYQNLGIMRLAARISELRDLGYDIRTVRKSAEDMTGTKHQGVADYVLISEPKEKAHASDQTREGLSNAI